MTFRFDPASLRGALPPSPLAARRARVLAQHLADAMPNRGRVLDIGSRDGAVATSLMKLRRDLKVESVALCTPLPFDDQSFEFITLVDVLSHAADPVALLVEAGRVARQCVIVKDRVVQGPLALPTLQLLDRRPGTRFLTPEQWQAAFYRARLTSLATTETLGLYPVPLSWLFDRRLHFVSVLAPRPGRR